MRHIIGHRETAKYIKNVWTIVAFSTGDSNKRLLANLRGEYKVTKRDRKVLQTDNLERAIEQYNEIS